MKKEKILAVDDERHITRLVQVNLERAGYEVVTAFDGVDALRRVEEEHPDLIVLDVMMPGLDGFGVLRQLKKDPRTEPIPVIMLTAKDDDKSVLDGWTKGVHCYLTKPFNPMELLAFVRRILDFEAEEDEDRFPI